MPPPPALFLCNNLNMCRDACECVCSTQRLLLTMNAKQKVGCSLNLSTAPAFTSAKPQALKLQSRNETQTETRSRKAKTQRNGVLGTSLACSLLLGQALLGLLGRDVPAQARRLIHKSGIVVRGGVGYCLKSLVPSLERKK